MKEWGEKERRKWDGEAAMAALIISFANKSHSPSSMSFLHAFLPGIQTRVAVLEKTYSSNRTSRVVAIVSSISQNDIPGPLYF